jgi:nucleoredoxin
VRTSIVALFALGSVGLALAGNLPPLGVKDVSLMLRSGYPIAAVEGEIATRHFIGTIDLAAEKLLVQAGATPVFIDLLKSGAHAVPVEQIAAVQEEIAAKAKRQELQAAEAQRLDTLYQSRKAAARPTATAALGTPISALVKGDLVTSKNGILHAFTDQAFEQKKLIGLYFSARWCGPCRKFTPQLVEYYNRVASVHPEFEIVFVSGDRSGPAMEAYMRDMQMPWPAVKYEKIGENTALRGYAGGGIPCLVLVDAAGTVISDSYAGKTYLGPGKVLADLDTIFAGGVIGQVAQQR